METLEKPVNDVQGTVVTQINVTTEQLKARRKLNQYSMVVEADFKALFSKEGELVIRDAGQSDEDFIKAITKNSVGYMLKLVDGEGNSLNALVNFDKTRITRLGITNPISLVDKYVKLMNPKTLTKGQEYPKEWFSDMKADDRKKLKVTRERTYCDDITILTDKALERLKESV